MKLSLTRDTRHERHQASKQATSNKKQQEPIDEGTKNSKRAESVVVLVVLRVCQAFAGRLRVARISPGQPHDHAHTLGSIHRYHIEEPTLFDP